MPLATTPDLPRRAPVRFRVPLDPASPPPRVDRKDGAELLTRRGFKVSPRTLESWPLTVRRINGRATYDTAELLAYAETKAAEAPPIRGGRKRTA